MLRAVKRPATRALSLLDLVVAIALLALLVYLVRLDWRHPPAETAPAAHSATHSSRTSV
jgi:hypothetical protein